MIGVFALFEDEFSTARNLRRKPSCSKVLLSSEEAFGQISRKSLPFPEIYLGLSLVKSFIVLLMPDLLCHQEPARRRIQSPLLGALERKIACDELVLYGIRAPILSMHGSHDYIAGDCVIPF